MACYRLRSSRKVVHSGLQLSILLLLAGKQCVVYTPVGIQYSILYYVTSTRFYTHICSPLLLNERLQSVNVSLGCFKLTLCKHFFLYWSERCKSVYISPNTLLWEGVVDLPLDGEKEGENKAFLRPLKESTPCKNYVNYTSLRRVFKDESPPGCFAMFMWLLTSQTSLDIWLCPIDCRKDDERYLGKNALDVIKSSSCSKGHTCWVHQLRTTRLDSRQALTTIIIAIIMDYCAQL